MGIYYYRWVGSSYEGGIVLGFLDKNSAEKHAKENYSKYDNEIEIEYLEEGEILDEYTGE